MGDVVEGKEKEEEEEVERQEGKGVRDAAPACLGVALSEPDPTFITSPKFCGS